MDSQKKRFSKKEKQDNLDAHTYAIIIAAYPYSITNPLYMRPEGFPARTTTASLV
jgi:hypothetical protein